MFKIRTMDDWFSTGGTPSAVLCPFHYRLLTNGGNWSIEGGSTYPCTWGAYYYDYIAAVGHPRIPYDMGAMVVSTVRSLQDSPSTTQDFDTSSTRFADNLWKLEPYWDNLEAQAGREPYAILSEFYAYGAPGVAYLVDLVAVINADYSSASSTMAFLDKTTINNIMRRPRIRGANTLYITPVGSYSLYVAGGDNGAVQVSTGGKPIQDSTEILHVYPDNTVAWIEGAPYSFSPSLQDVEGSYFGSPWGGYASVAGLSGKGDYRGYGGSIEIVAIGNTDSNTSSSNNIVVIDVIASAHITAAHIAGKATISSGLHAKVPSRANLGILFQPLVTSATPAFVQGGFRLQV